LPEIEADVTHAAGSDLQAKRHDLLDIRWKFAVSI